MNLEGTQRRRDAWWSLGIAGEIHRNGDVAETHGPQESLG